MIVDVTLCYLSDSKGVLLVQLVTLLGSESPGLQRLSLYRYPEFFYASFVGTD